MSRRITVTTANSIVVNPQKHPRFADQAEHALIRRHDRFLDNQRGSAVQDFDFRSQALPGRGL